MCNSCSKPLRGSKYYEVICRDARDHDKEERVDELQNDKEKKDEESRKAEEHDKVIEELKNALRKLTSEELEEEKEKLRDEIAKLRAELEELNPEDKDKDTKQERDSKLEHIGVDSSLITNTRYHVLTLNQSYRDSKSGDE